MSEAPLFGVTCFSSLAPCLRSGTIGTALGRGSQKAVREPEGRQDGANTGSIYQRRSQRNISKLALNLLWLLICSHLQNPWCVATTLRFKNQAKEGIPLSTEGTISWLVRLRPLYRVWSQSSRKSRGWRKGSGKWTRAQEDKLWRHLEKEMLDPEDCHLEGKEPVNAWKLITLPGAKAIKSRKEELRGTFFCFWKMKIALLLF